jgi:hypothetical protein
MSNLDRGCHITDVTLHFFLDTPTFGCYKGGRSKLSAPNSLLKYCDLAKGLGYVQKRVNAFEEGKDETYGVASLYGIQ